MPEGGKNKLTFQNHRKQLPDPFIINVDFEALSTKVTGPELDHAKSNTQRTQQHSFCSYNCVVVRCDGETEPPVEYRGPDAAKHFFQALQGEESKIKGLLADPKAMRTTREDWLVFGAAECHVYIKSFESDSVLDHCHITERYNWAAHSACNLKLRLSPKTTVVHVVFHNVRGNDSHLLMKAISMWKARSLASPTTRKSTFRSP